LSSPVLLDSSFLIAFERETARGEAGPARRFFSILRGRPVIISIVSIEEVLECIGADEIVPEWLRRFTIQGLHLAQARRCALLQRRSSRRLGENDAWLVATAEILDADVVGADRSAFERLGARYLRFR
jgi:predicted nucleic acid-binding protein